MKKLKTKWFTKWAKKQKLVDDRLLSAITDMQNNLSSINLGGGLYKVRVSQEHSGKSGAYRTIVVYRKDDRAVMVYGFMKKEQENLSSSELKSFKKLAKDILALNNEELDKAIENKVFTQIGEDK
ncbi:MAG: hypothetical protein COA92_03180 [Sulfurovum sp.]|nr:MAG: hypothetical protein COA92_03180 [Sulfurovum sp.]